MNILALSLRMRRRDVNLAATWWWFWWVRGCAPASVISDSSRPSDAAREAHSTRRRRRIIGFDFYSSKSPSSSSSCRRRPRLLTPISSYRTQASALPFIFSLNFAVDFFRQPRQNNNNNNNNTVQPTIQNLHFQTSGHRDSRYLDQEAVNLVQELGIRATDTTENSRETT